MDNLPVFSFPSANTTFFTASSPNITPRKSSHRRQKAVEIPIITTAKIRTPANYAPIYLPPRSYNRMSCRRLANNLNSIPETSSSYIPGTTPASIIPSMVSPPLRPSYFRCTSAESVTTTGSSCHDSESSATPESCRFSRSVYTTSSGLEPFPRLSMCDIDEQMGGVVEEEDDDDDEFWGCSGLPQPDSLKSSAVGAMIMEEDEMNFSDKIQAWRDSI